MNQRDISTTIWIMDIKTSLLVMRSIDVGMLYIIVWTCHTDQVLNTFFINLKKNLRIKQRPECTLADEDNALNTATGCSPLKFSEVSKSNKH